MPTGLGVPHDLRNHLYQFPIRGGRRIEICTDLFKNFESLYAGSWLLSHTLWVLGYPHIEKHGAEYAIIFAWEL